MYFYLLPPKIDGKDMSREKLIASAGKFLTEGVLRLTYINIADERLERQVSDLMREGQRPILYSNHQSHADGVILARIATYIGSLPAEALDREPTVKGFVLPVASSLVLGYQGKVAQTLYRLIAYDLEKRRNIVCLPYTRKVDEVKFGLKSNIGEVANIRKMIRSGYSLVVLPEATVAGGRKLPSGKIKGMQEVDDVAKFYRLAKAEHELFFLPIGIDGSHKIFSPDIYLPSRQAILTMMRLSSEIVTTANIGLPITVEQLERRLGVEWLNRRCELGNLLMQEVARLVPPHAGGFYTF